MSTAEQITAQQITAEQVTVSLRHSHDMERPGIPELGRTEPRTLAGDRPDRMAMSRAHTGSISNVRPVPGVHMRKSLSPLIGAAPVIAVLIAMSVPSAWAMGSGNPYVDHQVGVSYTVYQPTFTAGLKLHSVGSAIVDASCKTEQPLLVRYAGGKREFTIAEGNPMCSDIGNGQTVATIKLGTATGTVQAYCPQPVTKSCTLASVGRYGGHVDITAPALKGLRATRIWVETLAGHAISGQQLVRVATGMKPVTS